MDHSIFEMLIDQATNAAKRTRLVLMIATIISLAQLSAAYNFAFGFLRTFTEQVVLDSALGGALRTRLQDLQDMMIKSWVEQLSVNVNLLGIKFSVADASLVGSLALFIVCIWLFYSARRENHIIGKTCILAAQEGEPIKNRVFYGLSNIQLFGAVSNSDQPIASLDAKPGEKYIWARALIAIVFYLPAITVFLMVALDVLSLVNLKGVFRGSSETLYTYLTTTKVAGANPPVALWSGVWPKFFATLVVEIGITVTLYYLHRFPLGLR